MVIGKRATDCLLSVGHTTSLLREVARSNHVSRCFGNFFDTFYFFSPLFLLGGGGKLARIPYNIRLVCLLAWNFGPGLNKRDLEPLLAFFRFSFEVTDNATRAETLQKPLDASFRKAERYKKAVLPVPVRPLPVARG